MRKDDSFPHRKLTATFSSTCCKYWDLATVLFSRYAPTLGASTKPHTCVNRQLSPWLIRYSQRTNDEDGITGGQARFRAAAALALLQPPSSLLRGQARTSGGAGARARAGELLPNDPRWHNLYAAPGHIADKRRPIFPCRRRGASWRGWKRPQWRRCARRP